MKRLRDYKESGHNKLWGWFSLSYASFCVMPRVMRHAMPDNWQSKMADLLKEWDDTWTNQLNLGTRINATKNGKLTKWPSEFLNYRHPDKEFLAKMKKPYQWSKK